MWLPNDIIAEVEAVARFRYVNVEDTKLWNENRREGELRLLTGWEWIARNGSASRQGFKTRTVCMRDAWYVLVRHAEAPRSTRLRVVSGKGRAA
jgi:hypothetical protein